MGIYEHLDYRKYLYSELKRRKDEGLGFTQDQLAQASGLRNTYLTNVLKGRGNFNSDQIYALAANLKLSQKETDYLFLLKELDQTTSTTRKQTLKLQIEAIREESKKTENYISAKVRQAEHDLIMRYYSDPMIKVVHIMLQIPRYAQNHLNIGEDLNIQKNYLRKILATLVELDIIKLKEKTVEVLQKNFHLSKESPMLLPHQILMRQKSGQRLQEVSSDRRYSFSVTFSATEETRQFIHQKYLEFLKEIESSVKESKSENAYQINFDLFPWND
jgi:uncharacterized protein (TIGR02147 family)